MLSRFFQESDHLLARYAGESLEELLDRITRLQMIEQTLHRHASISENRLAAKNFRILRYNAAHAHQNTAWFWCRKIDVLLNAQSLLAAASISVIPFLGSCFPD